MSLFISVLSIIILILIVIILIAITFAILNINKDIKRGQEILDNIEKITENISSEQKKFDKILSDTAIGIQIKNILAWILDLMKFYKRFKK